MLSCNMLSIEKFKTLSFCFNTLFPHPLNLRFLCNFFPLLHHPTSFSTASDDKSDHNTSIIKYSSKNDSTNNNTEKESILNPRSPFYLHPGENPDATLLAPPLDDHNYHNWSKPMHWALTSNKKLGFINGTIIKPIPSDLDFEPWDRANNMVLS